jgi:mannose-1-phosphate guanylyltransferase
MAKTTERYLESNWALLEGVTLRHPPGRTVGIDPTARIHPTAAIVGPVRIGAGAVIAANVTVGPYAVVGAGARIDRSIARTVVWDGASARASNAGDSIVM